MTVQATTNIPTKFINKAQSKFNKLGVQSCIRSRNHFLSQLKEHDDFHNLKLSASVMAECVEEDYVSPIKVEAWKDLDSMERCHPQHIEEYSLLSKMFYCLALNLVVNSQDATPMF